MAQIKLKLSFTFSAGAGALQWEFAQFGRNVIFPPALLGFNSFHENFSFPKVGISFFTAFVRSEIFPSKNHCNLNSLRIMMPNSQISHFRFLWRWIFSTQEISQCSDALMTVCIKLHCSWN